MFIKFLLLKLIGSALLLLSFNCYSTAIDWKISNHGTSLGAAGISDVYLSSGLYDVFFDTTHPSLQLVSNLDFNIESDAREAASTIASILNTYEAENLAIYIPTYPTPSYLDAELLGVYFSYDENYIIGVGVSKQEADWIVEEDLWEVKLSNGFYPFNANFVLAKEVSSGFLTFHFSVIFVYFFYKNTRNINSIIN